MRERGRHRGEDRGRSGQFIIIAVLMIAIMIVSIGAVMYSTVTYYRYEQWEEYLSIIDNIKIGSLHLVEGGLANLTQTCSETRTMDRSILIDILDRWKGDLTTAMAEHGLAVDFLNNSRLISSNPERYVENLVNCYWYSPTSVSAFSADLEVNLSEFGLSGYKAPIFMCLSVELDTSYIAEKPTKIGEINVTVTHEDQSPVLGLTSNNFVVQKFNSSQNKWVGAELSKVTPLYGGRYKLTFKECIEEPYYEWLFVTVQDSRGITVISSTYSYIEFTVEKNTPVSGRPENTPDEIYTLEAGLNGIWHWNGKQLDYRTEEGVAIAPPVPPVPIKQFRVNVTKTGVDSTSVEVPCQYEIWDTIDWHGRSIDVPRDLADPYCQFNASNRMVFQVKFPTLDIKNQTVRIWWESDLDAEVYQGETDLEYFDGFYEAKTNVYRVEFMDEVNWDPRPEYRWPYYGVAALLLKELEHPYECYGPWNVHGFGLARTSPGTAHWRPYGQWQIKYWYGGTGGARAVVRLIAILNSTKVQNVWTSEWEEPRSDYYDTYAVIFLTANVKYLQQRVWVYWKQTKTDWGLWFTWEWGKGETDSYAYRNNQTDEVDRHAYNYEGLNHIEYDYPGYWASHWNDHMGRGLIFNVEGLDSLYSLNSSRTRFGVVHWAPEWGERYPQGSIDFEAINCAGEEYTVAEGTSYGYIPAMWLYGGGNEIDGYKEVANYYYMFLEPYTPTLIFGE